MRSFIVCALTLLVANAYLDRHDGCDDSPAPQVIVVDSFTARWNCERPLYPSYLGNRRDCYVGNIDPRMRRVDVRELPCETSLYASYLGNQPAWNECRRLKGLLAKSEQRPDIGHSK